MKKLIFISLLIPNISFGLPKFVDVERSRIEKMGYTIPADVKIVEGNRFMYNVTRHILTVVDREYSPEVWFEMMSKNEKNGFYFASSVSPDDDYRSSQARHEMGHAIDFASGLSSSEEWNKILNSIDVQKSISQYATTSPAEALAEAFSMYTSPLYGAKVRRLPEVVERFIETKMKTIK
jgi:hypothetical protein